MIQKIEVHQFSQVEDIVYEFLKRISQNEDQISQLKETLRKDVEANKRVILAAFIDENTPFGFGILDPSDNMITAFHPLDDTWTELFMQVFDYIQRNQSVLRIRGSAVPESMHGFMSQIGFSKDVLSFMSIQRGEIESLTLDDLPENFTIVRYSEAIQQAVAEMMFEGYLEASWAHQYPDYLSSLQACYKSIKEWSKTNNTSILTTEDIIVGSCHIGAEGIQRSIGNVAIKPEYRRRGLARILVTSVLLDAVKENPEIEQVLLATTHESPAFYLYESLGFVTNLIQPQFAWSKKE